MSSEGDTDRMATFDLTGSQISDDIVLVTYRSARGGHQAWEKLGLDTGGE